MSNSSFSGALWAGKHVNILIVGIGSVGSFTAFALNRCGHSLYLFDEDTIEDRNLGGQFFSKKQIGINKVYAIEETLWSFGVDKHIYSYPIMFAEEHANNFDGFSEKIDVVICAADDMNTKRLLYKASKDKNIPLFIDGRLTIEQGWVYALTKDSPHREEYEAMLADTSIDTIDTGCSVKSTTYCAMAVAAQITGIVQNYLLTDVDPEIVNIPYSIKFNFNLQTTEYAY